MYGNIVSFFRGSQKMELNHGLRGVYFLANNRVYDFTITFLNSFRKYNPDIKLCLIPYDNDANRIIELQDVYDFDIYTDEIKLKKCDEISFEFHGRILGAYRKLVTWEGPYDEFVYIDVDTVVLNNIDFAFRSLRYADIITTHSNMREVRKFVWLDTIDQTNILTRSQKRFAANTGFFVSKKNAMTLSWIEQQVPKALLIKEHMELMCMEQPFLNYLIVTSGKQYNSFYNLHNWGIDFSFFHEVWAGTKGGLIEGDKITFSRSRKIFLIHWAGFFWQSDTDSMENIPYIKLWKFYRDLRDV